MAQFSAKDPPELALSLGAGVLSLLFGLALTAVVALDSVTLLENLLVIVVVAGFAVAYTVAGLYDIVDRGVTRRGVADLVASGGLVLALLGPLGSPAWGFVATGALALLAAGLYHVALATDRLSPTEEPAVEVDGDETT